MRRGCHLWKLAWGLVAAASVSCDGGASGPASLTGELRLSGSTTVYPLAVAAAKEFRVRHPGVRVDVAQSSSGAGIADFIAGRADVATATRPPTEEEYDAARRAGLRPRLTVIAYDAIGVVVHRDNPVRDLTVRQLEQIFFTGEVSEWSALGEAEADGRIRVYHSDSKVSGTADLFESVVVGRRGSPYVTGSVQVARTPDLVPSVAQDRDGIGFTPLSWVTDDVATVRVEGVLGVDRTIMDGTYPFSRRLYLITDGVPSGPARAFIDYLLTTSCQQTVVRYAGFVPVL